MQARKLSGAALASHEAKLAGVKLPLRGAALAAAKLRKKLSKLEVVSPGRWQASVYDERRDGPGLDIQPSGGMDYAPWEDVGQVLGDGDFDIAPGDVGHGHEPIVMDDVERMDRILDGEIVDEADGSFDEVHDFGSANGEHDKYEQMALDYGVTEGFEPEEITDHANRRFDEALERAIEVDEEFEASKRRVDLVISLHVCGSRRAALLRYKACQIHRGGPDRRKTHASEASRKRRKNVVRHARGGLRTVDHVERLGLVQRGLIPSQELSPEEREYQRWYEKVKRASRDRFAAQREILRAKQRLAKAHDRLDDTGKRLNRLFGSPDHIPTAKAKLAAMPPEKLALPVRVAQ